MSEPEQHEPPQPQLILDHRFMGTKEPMWELPKEQPWHRLAAWAFARGATCKEVARRLDRSEPAVQNLLRQKWFQKEVTAIMAEYGAEDVIELFKAEQFNSLTTLIELRDNPRVPSSSRIACARDILDRALGKPVQRVETAQVTSSEDPVAEVARLEQEVTRMHRDNGAAVIAEGETGEGTVGADPSNGQDEPHNA